MEEPKCEQGQFTNVDELLVFLVSRFLLHGCKGQRNPLDVYVFGSWAALAKISNYLWPHPVYSVDSPWYFSALCLASVLSIQL